MFRLWQSCLLSICLSWLAVLSIVFIGLILPFVPWLRAPNIPHGAVYPVSLVVLGKSTELATLLGTPIGIALGARRWFRRMGTPALGRSWKWGLLSICAAGTLGFSLSLASINYWTLAPGRMARSALMAARDRCFEEPEPTGVSIPIVGAAWICGKSHAPRFEGVLPGSNRRASFSAGAVQVSDDLLSVDLEDFRLGVKGWGKAPNFQLRTSHVTVHGVRALFRPARLGFWRRALVASVTGFLLGGLAAYRILVRRWKERRWALLLSVGSAAVAATALMIVDFSATGAAWLYLGVPMSGVVTSALVSRFIDYRRFASARAT